MERRTFLLTGLAAGVTASLSNVAFLPDSASATTVAPETEMLTASMIWSSQSVPVQLLQDGAAAKIASSSDGHATVETPDLHSVFAREFSLDVLPATALMRLFSYTRYRLYVNGVYCGRGPSRYQNQRPEYDTREIGAALKTGRNVVTVLVHCDSPTGRIMRHKPGFAAVVSLGAGSTAANFATDPSWRSRPDRSFGPRDKAWASIEEHIDARQAVDLSNPSLSIESWPGSVVVRGPEFLPVWPRTTPLQQEKLREWSGGATSPQAMELAKDLSIDLPEIIQGYHSLELDANEGSKIEISYLLPEGDRSGKSTFVAREGRQSYMGGDTFAFNRLSLRLVTGRATLNRAQAVEVRYPFERAGSFECSDAMLTQLWKICARSLELMSEDSYVDCADRERVEWTDDCPPAFDCTRVMMRGPDQNGKQYWGDSRLLKALLRRIALTQQPDGQMKAHSCSDRWDIHAIMEDRSCDWVIQLREYFDASGDRQFVKEMWPALTRLMQWFLDHRTERGLVLAREWEVWDNPLRYQVCEGAGLNALFFKALCDSAYLGEKIGETSKTEALAENAKRLQRDFNALLWNAGEETYDGALFGPGSKTSEQLNGKMFPGPIVNGRYQPTVQAALFALYSGIVPESRIGAVRRWVLAHSDDVKGPMSSYFLFDALYAMEEQVHDREVLQRIRSGWKPQVDSVWQTTWEDLNGGSKAHLYGMVPGYFLSSFVLGARRAGPVSLRSIVMEPRHADLEWARGIAVTEFGPVEMKWQRSASGGLSIHCSTPDDTKTTLRIYRTDNIETIQVDGQSRRARSSGNFIELPLSPGRHEIQYPG